MTGGDVLGEGGGEMTGGGKCPGIHINITLSKILYFL